MPSTLLSPSPSTPSRCVTSSSPSSSSSPAMTSCPLEAVASDVRRSLRNIGHVTDIRTRACPYGRKGSVLIIRCVLPRARLQDSSDHALYSLNQRACLRAPSDSRRPRHLRDRYSSGSSRLSSLLAGRKNKTFSPASSANSSQRRKQPRLILCRTGMRGHQSSLRSWTYLESVFLSRHRSVSTERTREEKDDEGDDNIKKFNTVCDEPIKVDGGRVSVEASSSHCSSNSRERLVDGGGDMKSSSKSGDGAGDPVRASSEDRGRVPVETSSSQTTTTTTTTTNNNNNINSTTTTNNNTTTTTTRRGRGRMGCCNVEEGSGDKLLDSDRGSGGKEYAGDGGGGGGFELKWSPSLSDHVWVSYNEEDRAEAAELLATLKAEGLTCLDTNNDEQAGPVLKITENALTTARWVVPLVTPKYLACQQSRFDLHMALCEMYYNQRAMLVPVLKDLQETSLPMYLYGLTTVNITNDRDNRERDKLVSILTGREVPLWELMPVGNVSHGMVWAYYLNYFQIILPDLKSRIDQWCKTHNCVDMRMPRKLYLLVPDSCMCPDSLDRVDQQVKFCGHLEPEMRSTAGSVGRIYRLSVWSLQKKDGESVQFVAEYPAILATLYRMERQRTAGLDRRLMEQERERFVTILRKRIHDDGWTDHVQLVIYQDRDSSGNLRPLSPILEPYLVKDRV